MARSKSVIQVLITGESRGLQRATASGVGALGSLAVGMFKLTAAAAGLAASIGAIAVRQFASFDEQMTRSTAIMGDLSDTMREDLANAAREVGRNTTKGAVEAASAIYDLSSAGLEAEQILVALPQVAAFAEAGMMEMGEAGMYMTGVFNAMRMGTGTASGDLEQFSRVMDVLTEANNLGAGSVADFAAALTNDAAAGAAIVGKDIEETTAVLVAFAQQNVIGAEAGSRTAILFRDIARAAAANSAEFAALGVEVFDANGNFRNMADVIGEFEGLFAGMSDAQKASALDQLGLTRTVGDSIRQLTGYSDVIRETEAALRDSGGTTEEVAAKQRDTLNAQLTILKNNLNDAAIELGSVLVPKLLELFEALGGQEAVANLGENLTAAFEKLDEFLSPVVDTIKNDVIPAIQENLPAAMAAAQPAIDTLKAVFQTVGDVIRDNIIPLFADLMGRLQEMQPAIDGVAAFFQDILLPAIQAVIGFITDTVIPIIANILQPVFEVLGESLGRLAAKWTENKDKIQPVIDLFNGIWAFIRDKLSPIIGSLIASIFRLATWAIEKLLGGLINLIELVGKAVDWFKRLRNAADDAAEASSSAAGGGDGGLQKRAKGGPVSSNVPYWVGEQGPEVFVPRTAGYVLPNGWMSEVGTPVEFGSGGGVTIEAGAVVVNLNMAGEGGKDVARTVRREVDAALKQLARELAVS